MPSMKRLKPKKLRNLRRQRKWVMKVKEGLQSTIVARSLTDGRLYVPNNFEFVATPDQWLTLMSYAPALATDPDFAVTVTYKGYRIQVKRETSA